MYTKEQKATEKKTLPVKAEYIPEQLSLLSSEEVAKLWCPSGPHIPREGRMQTSDTTEARRARSRKGDAIQDTLPGF